MRMYRANGFIRISKKRAEHMYDNGEMVYLCPHKMRPGPPWHPEIAVTKADYNTDVDVQYFISDEKDFASTVNDYTHYNCNYSVGEYPAYYIKG